MKSYMAIQMINTLYEKIVVSNSEIFTNKQGIFLKFNVRSNCWGFEQDGNTHHPEWEGSCTKYFSVILLNRYKVFIKVKDKFSNKITSDGWENTSNHPSGWRFGCDSLTHLCFDVVDKAWRNYPKELITEDKDARVNISEGGFGFKLVEVEYKDKKDNNYFKEITDIKLINKKVTV